MTDQKRRSAPIVEAVVRALEAAPLAGLRFGQVIRLCGLLDAQGTAALQYAVDTGRAYRLCLSKSVGGSRYFPSAQAMAAGQQTVFDEVSALMAERQAREKKPIERKAPTERQQPDARTQRAKQNIMVGKGPTEAPVRVTARRSAKDAKVVFPANFKHTVAAPAPDHRYAAAPGFEGEFRAEWRRLRGES